jgi:hypothetical protein
LIEPRVTPADRSMVDPPDTGRPISAPVVAKPQHDGSWRALTNAPACRSDSYHIRRRGARSFVAPCAMSSLTPVRDDLLGAARPFGLWTTRSAPWFPIKRRRDPGLGPLFNVAWLRRDPNLGRVGTEVQRLSVRHMEPHRPHLTALRRSRQAVAPCTR